jgi:pilus assembly protein CpaD
MSGVRVAPTPAALPEASQATPLGDDQIAVVVERYALQLPACPDWTERPNQNFDNQPGSFWSCATAINLGMMVADPGDLVRGRSIGDADGTTMARSVQRYRLGQTKDLIRDAASAEIFPSPAPAPESKSSISTTGK